MLKGLDIPERGPEATVRWPPRPSICKGFTPSLCPLARSAAWWQDLPIMHRSTASGLGLNKGCKQGASKRSL